MQAAAMYLTPCRLVSAQAGREFRRRLHFALAHPGRDLSHDLAVDVLAFLVGAAVSRLECLQLRQGVVSVLAAHARISGGNAHAVGRMTRGAGGHSAWPRAAGEDL